MDFSGHVVNNLMSWRLIGLVIATSVLPISNADEIRRLPERDWVASDASLLASYSARPVECVRSVFGKRLEQQRLGRIAFNSPRLLGGQSGRMGLSCASCHLNGRGNRHFFLKQISSAPGTADISHSFLSSTGGDAQLNAKPIPDLAHRQAAKFPERSGEGFSKHLRQLVEVEFDGQPATPIIYRALKIYLQDVDVSHCHNSATKTTPKSLDEDWRLVEDTLWLLGQPSFAKQVTPERIFLLNSVRALLETIYQNFGIDPDDELDQSLLQLSVQFSQLKGVAVEQDYRSQLDKLARLAVGTRALLKQNHSTSAYHTEAFKKYLRISTR